jgi:hypothetical protein
MESNPLRARGNAFEEAYIRQIEAERLQKSLVESGRKALRTDLGVELEIRDVGLLDRLVELGITPDTAAAFEALPLVEVAWADGDVDPEERWRVLGIATAFGLELGRPAHAQLELWLIRRPPGDLFDAWYRFAERRFSTAEAAERARRVLEGVHEVAVASGGLFGFGAVSGAEREATARIHQALAGALADPI